ncbi:hypothetical protein L9F63_024379 [Diploptera punctata]|uniref:Uncharacterized protein n=1 Tax=Diploptera punctata TaxID=6984 RepID=A0AAD7ZH46_DIPPU|nr:hypothetical protein L9F63_024379 [Diploptera punctata]
MSRDHSSGTTMTSSFIGSNNPGNAQHTLQSPKGRQKNISNVGRFNSEVNTSTSFTGTNMTITTTTKGKRGRNNNNSNNSNNNSEQQHYDFESHESASDVSRMNIQHQSNKSVGRSQIYPMQQYQSHTSPQQGPPPTPPNTSTTSTAPKKGRGSKSVQSDRSPSYSSAGSSTEAESQHQTDNASNNTPKNQGQQQHSTPSQSPQSTSNFPSQFPPMDNSSNKPLDPYSNPMYGHQQYYPAPGYYGGYGAPQQPPIGFGSGPYYSGDPQYGTGRGVPAEQSAAGSKSEQDAQKGSQTQTVTPSQQQHPQPSQTLQSQPQSSQPTSQPNNSSKITTV